MSARKKKVVNKIKDINLKNRPSSARRNNFNYRPYSRENSNQHYQISNEPSYYSKNSNQPYQISNEPSYYSKNSKNSNVNMINDYKYNNLNNYMPMKLETKNSYD